MSGTMMHLPLTISTLIEHADRFHGQTEIVSVEISGEIRRSNWGEVAANSRRLHGALKKLGVSQGDRCATIAWNNQRHLEIYFGVSGAGMVCHTLNPRLSLDQMVFIINDAQDKVLLLDQTFLPFLGELKGRIPSVEHVICMGKRDDSLAQANEGLLFYDDLLADSSEDIAWPELPEQTPSSLCYTSGTTGNPKGVLYTHRSTMLHSLSANNPDGMAIAARDVVLPVVPMFHVNAWGVPYIAAAVGSTLILPGPKLDGQSLVSLMEAEQVTLALGVPTIWMGLLEALRQCDSKLEHLERTIVGGAAIPPSMITEFRESHGVEAIHAWGMTETSPLGTLNQLMRKHHDLPADKKADLRANQGRPPFGVDIRILDEGGQVLPNDGATQGDLQVRGHWIVDSYFGKSESACTPDGWFDTGDVATIDSDGFLTIRDRSKDIIKSGGEWISTVELENIAVSHPKVANAAVIAAKHERWDERPVLIVAPVEGCSVDEQNILDLYPGAVAKWQIPDKVIFVDALPLGATGKVQKIVLREQYSNVLIES